MFCDQDDVWVPGKVRALRQAMEAGRNDGPRLVHCDMQVVDQALNPIAPSLWRRQRVDPENTQLRRMLLQNSETGHSALFNRALAELASPIPAEAFMHDWWLALTAAAFGTIAAVDRPLTLYRQHTGNVLGSRQRTAARFLSWDHWRRKILRRGHPALGRGLAQPQWRPTRRAHPPPPCSPHRHHPRRLAGTPLATAPQRGHSGEHRRSFGLRAKVLRDRPLTDSNTRLGNDKPLTSARGRRGEGLPPHGMRKRPPIPTPATGATTRVLA